MNKILDTIMDYVVGFWLISLLILGHMVIIATLFGVSVIIASIAAAVLVLLQLWLLKQYFDMRNER